MNPIALIDDFLNELTMYRLLTYGLVLLGGISLAFSFFGTITLMPKWLVVSGVVLSVSCYVTNVVLAKIWHTTANHESSIITTLILFFILPPGTGKVQLIAAALAGVIAMASKYMVAYHNRHIFNPAAFAAVVIGLLGIEHATWWIGNSTMWPFVLFLGLLIVRKIRRFSMLLSFAITTVLVVIVVALMQHQAIGSLIRPVFLESPFIFLGTIMLTEPSTMPSRRWHQVIFGAIVGALYGLHPQLPGVYVYAETALVIGNVYAFLVSPKRRYSLRLKEINMMSDRVRDYVFTPDHKLEFLPGQYMEWTLPGVGFDARGNRRTFTIASSPTETDVHLGVKFYEPSSKYKATLQNLKPGGQLFAGQIAGDFTLPTDSSRKLAFIAGGIGITPFRSMLKYLLDTDQTRDIVLLYLVSLPDELIYKEIMQQAIKSNIKVIPILTSGSEAPTGWQGAHGKLSETLISHYIPDFSERKFYVSGPNAMVHASQKVLRGMSVHQKNITADYFSGY